MDEEKSLNFIFRKQVMISKLIALPKAVTYGEFSNLFQHYIDYENAELGPMQNSPCSIFHDYRMYY